MNASILRSWVTPARCALLAALALLTGCLEPEKTVLLEDPPADSVTFWPPNVQYARQGDTLHLLVHGLKRRKTCAVPLQVSWDFNHDSSGFESYRVRSRFEVPGDASCAPDPAGLDTSFRVRFYTRPGKRLYLRTPDGRITDSLLFIAPETPELVNVITLRHLAGGGDSTVGGRAVYRDSTPSHPRRTVRVDPLETCEILQTATYEYRGDTTLVKIRLIKATLQSSFLFPACADARADSVEVAFNRYNFLP